jgi:hypothetical protein
MKWTLRIVRLFEICLSSLIFSIILSGSFPISPATPAGAARRFTRPYEFNFVNWTVDALDVKLGQASIDTPFFFSETARQKIVSDYLKIINNILYDEYKLDLIYTDPTVKNPSEASSSLKSDLAGLNIRQRQIAPMAEAILQEQISETLAALGLAQGGQVIPPVLSHVTPLPYNLVISPRGKIQEDASISLIPDLPVDKQVALESQVDQHLNVSSLVVPVGGIATYPNMVQRSTDLHWLVETFSHEWTHNWLTLHPLGLNYDTNPNVRTMNETTASISGTEIAQIVLRRYYPELNFQYAMRPQEVNLPGIVSSPGFNFRAEMHTTRVHADELLAAGKITEAETYLEERRTFFWNQGCPECFIRKLNQAYFAFYGAYADIPGGAAGEDPVGPAVRAFRAQSGSLYVFLKTIAQMSSFQQLKNALAQ